MKTKYYLSGLVLICTVALTHAQTMRWIPTPAQSVFGKCTDQSSKSGLTQCYVLEYTPKVTGVLTSYTTGFMVSCTSLGSAIAKNQGCSMVANNNVVNGCSGIGKVLMNSSGNSGTITNNQITAGVPVILHQVCLTIPSGESVSIEEDPVTDLTTSVDLGNGSFVTEFPTFQTATFRRIRYDAAQQTAFLDFQGVPAGDRISQLDWSVSAESDAASFVVERSIDGETYDAIGEVQAVHEDKRMGVYQFLDKAAVIGDNYYRLRQTGVEAQDSYSPVRKIVFGTTPMTVAASPNPARDKLYVRIKDARQPGTLTMTDVSGKERLNLRFEASKTDLELELNTLEEGIYTLRVSSDTDTYLEKIVVIR